MNNYVVKREREREKFLWCADNPDRDVNYDSLFLILILILRVAVYIRDFWDLLVGKKRVLNFKVDANYWRDCSNKQSFLLWIGQSGSVVEERSGWLNESCVSYNCFVYGYKLLN